MLASSQNTALVPSQSLRFFVYQEGSPVCKMQLSLLALQRRAQPEWVWREGWRSSLRISLSWFGRWLAKETATLLSPGAPVWIGESHSTRGAWSPSEQAAGQSWDDPWHNSLDHGLGSGKMTVWKADFFLSYYCTCCVTVCDRFLTAPSRELWRWQNCSVGSALL